MKMRSLACLLLLVSAAAQAEEFFPEQRLSQAEADKGWNLAHLADAHLALGEYSEGVEAAKSAYRILRDVRIIALVAWTYEDWGAHVSDPKEAFRLYQKAVFFYGQAQRLLPTVARGAPIGWVQQTLEQRLPPLKEQLAKADKHAKKSRHRPAHTVAALETELVRTRDELAKKSDELAQERATRAALEQALRALAAQKPLCPVCEAPIPVSARYAEAKLGK
jgi:tetratricopeptide (TPR) repeat protein